MRSAATAVATRAWFAVAVPLLLLAADPGRHELVDVDGCAAADVYGLAPSVVARGRAPRPQSLRFLSFGAAWFATGSALSKMSFWQGEDATQRFHLSVNFLPTYSVPAVGGRVEPSAVSPHLFDVHQRHPRRR